MWIKPGMSLHFSERRFKPRFPLHNHSLKKIDIRLVLKGSHIYQNQFNILKKVKSLTSVVKNADFGTSLKSI